MTGSTRHAGSARRARARRRRPARRRPRPPQRALCRPTAAGARPPAPCRTSSTPSDDALWGLATNGIQLRLMRDNASLTRPAYIEADLGADLRGRGRSPTSPPSGCSSIASRFGARRHAAADCALERWREAGAQGGRDRPRPPARRRRGRAAQPRHRLPRTADNGAARPPRIAATLPLHRVVQRAPAPRLSPDLPAGRPRTATCCTRPTPPPSRRSSTPTATPLGRLRDRAVRRAAWDQHHDRWEGLLVTFRALARGEPRSACRPSAACSPPASMPRSRNRPPRATAR